MSHRQVQSSLSPTHVGFGASSLPMTRPLAWACSGCRRRQGRGVMRVMQPAAAQAGHKQDAKWHRHQEEMQVRNEGGRGIRDRGREAQGEQVRGSQHHTSALRLRQAYPGCCAAQCSFLSVCHAACSMRVSPSHAAALPVPPCVPPAPCASVLTGCGPPPSCVLLCRVAPCCRHTHLLHLLVI